MSSDRHLVKQAREAKFWVQAINEREFETQVLCSAQPVLVGFLKGWSQPCQLIEPVLEKVAIACMGTAKVLKVNSDDNPDLALWYGIRAVPTLIYFTDGTVRGKIVGIASPKAILTRLQMLTQATSHDPSNTSA